LHRIYTHFAELGIGDNMVRIGTLLVMLVMATGLVLAQNAVVNSLTFTQGQYRLTLTAPTLTGDVSGTLLSTATGWALGGNALVGAGPSDNRIGTTDAVDVQLIAGGTTNVRLQLSSADAATLVPNQGAIRFLESGGTDYVGVRAPAAIGTSYTVSLPATAPTAGQVLRATSATETEWRSIVRREIVNADPANAGSGGVDIVLTTTMSIGVDDALVVLCPTLNNNLIVHNARRTGPNEVTARINRFGALASTDDPARDFIVIAITP